MRMEAREIEAFLAAMLEIPIASMGRRE